MGRSSHGGELRAGRTILLIAGGLHHGTEILYALGRTRQRAWLLPLSSESIALTRSRWCAGIAPGVDAPPGPDLRGAIRRAVRGTGATHIVASTVASAVVVSEMLGELGSTKAFPAPTGDLIRRLDDKAAFSTLARTLHLPMVQNVSVDDEAGARAHGLDYPIVLKPVDCSAGMGIRYCTSHDMLEFELGKWPTYPQLIERFVPGRDVHLTFLSSEGEIVAWEAHEPHPSEEVGYGACHFYRDEQALAVGRQLAGALRYTGMANLDFRRDESGELWLLECNPRLYRRIGLAAMAGVNFLQIGLDLADGLCPDAPPISVRDQVVCNPTALPLLVRRGMHDVGPSAVGDALGFLLSDPLLAAGELRRSVTRTLQRRRIGRNTPPTDGAPAPCAAPTSPGRGRVRGSGRGSAA